MKRVNFLIVNHSGSKNPLNLLMKNVVIKQAAFRAHEFLLLQREAFGVHQFVTEDTNPGLSLADNGVANT